MGSCQFKSISNLNFSYVLDDNIDDLRQDQDYALAVMAASVVETLKTLEVGGLTHAGCMSLACHILQCYVYIQQPSTS